MSDQVLVARPVDPPAVEGLRRAREALAPSGDVLARLLAELHQESAREQPKARRNMARMRGELLNRLKGLTMEHDGQRVVVAIVSTGELVRAIEAEANVVKTEAMAQRSYDVHRALQRAGGPQGVGSFEDWLTSQEDMDSDLSPEDRTP